MLFMVRRQGVDWIGKKATPSRIDDKTEGRFGFLICFGNLGTGACGIAMRVEPMRYKWKGFT